MLKRIPLVAIAAGGVAAVVACSSDTTTTSKAAPGDAGVVVSTAEAGTDGANAFDTGAELRVPVPAGQRVYVSLASPPSIKTPAAPKTDLSWDLAFEGLEVFTNSGPSGGGNCSAFGPLDEIAFLDDVAPAAPFLAPDQTGGAFLRWYDYSGAPDHILYSRYHDYGVQDGATQYRVQILNYYGTQNGTPGVSGIYRIRYSAVGAQAITVDGLDGTAGGPTGGDDAKSECIDLGTGTRTMLTPAEASTSSAWHLCFRRDNISVNGGSSGPRNVTAVDFDAAKTASETLAQVSGLTDDGTLPAFNAITAASFNGAALRADGVVSAFDPLWIDPSANPPAPAASAWYVVGADGKQHYLVGFSSFDGATATSPGTVVMRIKAVQ